MSRSWLQHRLSRFIAHLAYCRWQWLKNSLIRVFIWVFRVDLSQAANTDINAYPHFNAFFTRALKPSARTIVTQTTAIACPVDGIVSQVGKLDGRKLLQAKGLTYPVDRLLALQEPFCERCRNGLFATFYLAPRDYHRVHMPMTGELQKMIYVPGELFSVNEKSACRVPNLFARNERLINIFTTQAGLMIIVMVGAMLVAGVETVWYGLVAPNRRRNIQAWDYPTGKVSLQKGQEMGRFQYGSTVILLFEPNAMTWINDLKNGIDVKLGQLIGTIV